MDAQARSCKGRVLLCVVSLVLHKSVDPSTDRCEIRLGPKGAKGAQISFPKRIFAFPLPQPPPRPKFCRPAPPPPFPAGLGFVGVQLHGSIFKNCFFVLNSMTSCWPGLSDVSETRAQPATPAGQACPPASNPSLSETGLAQPATPSKPSPACPAQAPALPARQQAQPVPMRLVSTCLTCLRLASGPAQPATCHPASGPSVYETGLAHAQLSPTRPQPASPAQAPAHLRACQPLGRPPGQVCLRPVSRV